MKFIIFVLIPSLQQLCCSGKKFQKRSQPSKVFERKPGNGYCLDANNWEATARHNLATGNCTQAQETCRADQFCVAYACTNLTAVLYTNTSCDFSCGSTAWIQNASLITHAGVAHGRSEPAYLQAECYVVATGAIAATAATGPFGSGYLVTDMNNVRIQYCEANATGTVLCTTVAGTPGSQGSGAGQFHSPMGLAVESDGMHILVADSYNHRIQRCPASLNGSSQNCTTVAKMEVNGAWVYGFSLRNPSDVAAEAGGTFLVADRSNHRVVRCSSSGNAVSACTLVAGTGIAGPAANQFYYPQSVAIESSGDFLVADRYNQRVQRCAANGTGEGSPCTTVAGITSTQGTNSTTLNDPYCVDSEINGDFLVCDQHNYRIQRCPASGSGICSTVAGVTGSQGSGINQVGKTYAVAAESDGSFKVEDTGNNRILHCSSGNCSVIGPSGYADSSSNDGVNQPRGLAIGR